MVFFCGTGIPVFLLNLTRTFYASCEKWRCFEGNEHEGCEAIQIERGAAGVE